MSDVSVRPNPDKIGEIINCLSLPAQKAAHPALILLCGLPASGKSFVARRIARKLPAVIISTDRVRKMLFPKPLYTSGESALVYSFCYELIKHFLAQKFNVIFDGTNLIEFHRRIVYRLAKERGATLIPVMVVAPEEVITQRFEAQKTGRIPRYHSDADWAIYQKMKGTLEPIAIEHIVIDTSKGFDEEIREIIGRASPV